MEDLEEFGELYDDLEGQAFAGVTAVNAGEGADINPKEGGAAYGDEMTESGSSDSEDDLRIVLNEEDHAEKVLRQLLGEGSDGEEDVAGDDLVIVTGTECSGKELRWAERGKAGDGLAQENGAAKGARRNWSRSPLERFSVSARNPLSARDYPDQLTTDCLLDNGSYNQGFPMGVSKGYGFYLPRNRSIFDIDVESFECKPWRLTGVDMTDYFNFGMDEQGWKNYCKQLVYFLQNKLPVLESSKLNQLTSSLTVKGVQYGHEKRTSTNPDILDDERKGFKLPKGRAIQVESGSGERIPSIDLKRSRNWDSDVVIQITNGLVVEDESVSIRKVMNHWENETQCEVSSSPENELSRSSLSAGTAHKYDGSSDPIKCHHQQKKNAFSNESPDVHVKPEPDSVEHDKDCPSRDTSLLISAKQHCSSSKSSNGNVPSQASSDTISVGKVRSPECMHTKSDCMLQESLLSDCSPSSEIDIKNPDHRTFGNDMSSYLGELNTLQQRMPCSVPEFNTSSDDECVSPEVMRLENGVFHCINLSGSIMKNWDDDIDARGHLTRGKRSMDSIKYYNGMNVNIKSFMEHPMKCSSLNHSYMGSREKSTAARNIKTIQNDCYTHLKRHGRKMRSIVDRDVFLSSSQDKSLYDKKDFHLWQRSRRVDKQDMLMDANYDAMTNKYQHREKSAKEFGRNVPYLFEELKSCHDKHDKTFCTAGDVRKLQQSDCCGQTMLSGFKRSSTFFEDNYEISRCSGSYDDAYNANQRGWHDDGPFRPQVPTLCRPDKRYMSHNGFPSGGKTCSNPLSQCRIVSGEEHHHFASRKCFEFDSDHFPAVKSSFAKKIAYSKRTKCSQALSGSCTKEEASRNQHPGNSYSPERHTLYSCLRNHDIRVKKNNFENQQYFDYRHRDHSQINLTVRSCKNSDTGLFVSHLADNIVNNADELADRSYRKALRGNLNGRRGKPTRSCDSGCNNHGGNGNDPCKEPRDSKHNKSSDYNVNIKGKILYPTTSKEERKDCNSDRRHVTKSSNEYPISHEEIEELEEGQLVEEAEDQDYPDQKNSTLTANTISSFCHTKDEKMDSAKSTLNNKSVGKYDGNHLLETLAKMEKRRQRFKDPIYLKESQKSVSTQHDTSTVDEVQQQRPARKRRWADS